MADVGREALLAGRALGTRYRLCVPREAMRGMNGTRLGSRAGTSLDFHDYRAYQPGDDLRHLDWRVYARTDREIIKLFREEVAPLLDVVLDDSRSMRLPGTAKASAALTLAAALATAAEQARFGHKVWLAGGRTTALEGSQGDVAGWRVPGFDAAPPADESGGWLQPAWRPSGIRVLVSDVLWPAPPLHVVRRLAERAAALTVVQVLAREEVAPDFRGTFQLEDMETDEVVDVFADAAACTAYGAALAQHREAWAAACRSVGARFVMVTAEELVVDGRIPALEACGLLEPAG